MSLFSKLFCIRRRSGNVRGIPRGDYIRDSVPQEPITRKEPATTRYSFHRVLTDRSIFSLNLSRIQIPTGHMNPSDQLQSEARTSVDMSTWCRRVYLRPHCFILTEVCSCRLEMAYFAGKISENRLVCKNAVALAYYESCRLFVMGSCVPPSI